MNRTVYLVMGFDWEDVETFYITFDEQKAIDLAKSYINSARFMDMIIKVMKCPMNTEIYTSTMEEVKFEK